MFSYTPKTNDTAFRKVDLSVCVPADRLPAFTEFDAERRPVQCQPRFVLEILHSDGSTTIVGPPETSNATYTRDARGFRLSTDFPAARLFVQSQSCPALRYKAPVDWSNRDGLQYCAVGGDPDTLELVGDAYFSARYTLIRR